MNSPYPLPNPNHNLKLESDSEPDPNLTEQSTPPPLPQSRSPFFNIRQPLWKYILKMGLVSLLGSLIIAAALSPFTGDNGRDVMKALTRNSPGPFILFLSIVFIAPVVETLLLALGLKIISLFTKKMWKIVLASSLIWAAIHSLSVPTWGLMVMWPFMVFSMAWMAWRRRSIFHAFAAAAGIHMFQNFWPGLILLANLLF